jgi:hypothetical protein
MGTPRSTTEIQLKNLKSDRELHASKLKAAGKSDADLARNTKWRKLNGDVRQIEARLRQIAFIESREAAVVEAKAAREAAEG